MEREPFLDSFGSIDVALRDAFDEHVSSRLTQSTAFSIARTVCDGTFVKQ